MDTPGSEYFTYLRLKSHEGAINQAKVDVAEAKYKGDVGEKKRLGLTRQEVAKIEADTLIFENTKAIDIGKAQSELSTKQSEFNKNIEIANIEAKKAATIRESELQKIVEVERALVNTERLRAETIAKAKVDAESSNALADAEFCIFFLI